MGEIPEARPQEEDVSWRPSGKQPLLSDDDFFLDECSVRRACDLENMYVDPTKSLQEHGHLEKRFAVFENKVSCIYRKLLRYLYKDRKPLYHLKNACII